jgi:hypothetical protein
VTVAPDAVALPQMLIRDDPAQRCQREEVALERDLGVVGLASAIAAVRLSRPIDEYENSPRIAIPALVPPIGAGLAAT